MSSPSLLPLLSLISIMSALEQIRPFFRFCQCVGFFPFRMEINRRTRRFQQFSFSWRFPITWWFVELALLHLIVYYFVYTTILASSEVNALPLIIYGALTTAGAIYILVLLTSRYWVTFRLSALCRAIELVHQIEKHLKEHPDCKCTIKRRIAVGLICSVFWISGALLLPLKVLRHSLLKEEEKWISYVVLGIAGFMMMSSTCAFVFIHLVYYQMSYYIRLLRYRLTEGFAFYSQDNGFGKLQCTLNEDMMKKGQNLFGSICKAVKEWNHIFSFPALFIITLKMITASCSLFGFIQGLILPNYYLNTARWFMLATSIMDCIMMAIIFTAADMPVQEALLLREEIIEINNNWLSLHSVVSPICLQASSFLEQIKEDRLRLSTGLFNVGVHLVPALTGSIVTYLVILLQTA